MIRKLLKENKLRQLVVLGNDLFTTVMQTRLMTQSSQGQKARKEGKVSEVRRNRICKRANKVSRPKESSFITVYFRNHRVQVSISIFNH